VKEGWDVARRSQGRDLSLCHYFTKEREEKKQKKQISNLFHIVKKFTILWNASVIVLEADNQDYFCPL
jgi:hypothetical protein